MKHVQSNFSFWLMSLIFSVRDKVISPLQVLSEVDILPGMQVLDYGCGPGGFSMAVTELVGSKGVVYAADLHPQAIKTVARQAEKRQLHNVRTIHTDCETGLPDNSIDVVLLYDIFHSLDYPENILAELHRVLKTKSVLSFSDHHLSDREIVETISASGLFKLISRQKETFSFRKV